MILPYLPFGMYPHYPLLNPFLFPRHSYWNFAHPMPAPYVHSYGMNPSLPLQSKVTAVPYNPTVYSSHRPATIVRINSHHSDHSGRTHRSGSRRAQTVVSAPATARAWVQGPPPANTNCH